MGSKHQSCPFCGSDNHEPDWTRTEANVWCKDCGAMGPNVLIDFEANDRAVWRAAAYIAWDRRENPVADSIEPIDVRENMDRALAMND